MCLKAIGVELPLMPGTRPYVLLQVFYDECLVCAGRMSRSYLPVHAPLLPPMAALLQLDRRARGERRPKRLVLGRFDRFPYHYYMIKLPGTGLLFPDGDLGHLSLRLWLELYDPLAYGPLFHLLGSGPVADRFGRTRWAAHRHWSLASCYGQLHQVQEATDCGCGVRVSMGYACTRAGAARRVRCWYADAYPTQ